MLVIPTNSLLVEEWIKLIINQLKSINMKKFQLTLLSLTFVVTSLTSCTSPESAAEEVCGCFSKISSSKNTAEMSGAMSECSALSAKYQGKFEGEDLNKFSTKVAECTVGSMNLR